MKSATAYQKFIHTTPRKLRLIADAIRGMNVAKALTYLEFLNKRAAGTMKKIVIQAAENAKSVHAIESNQLTISELNVEEGPRIKRFRPVARGMAHPYAHKMSHIKIKVSEGK